ncbi:ribonuclease P protein component [Actinomadura parmotrematis]|uniref:Ribonuclease P protein component n=1 Tax=Actinomadura parmotrematis TaxID=2864039 RepID=A0ABS7G3N9_9ACTN|nr:ribonuclease P protein component [Actinomadura parmotrematis]MBW8487076.1 ribonuclease P protein component [Actinomadura parmotrematis]
MLPSGNRMRRRDEFTSAVRRGRRAGRPTVVLHLLRPSDPGPSDTGPSAVGSAGAGTAGTGSAGAGTSGTGPAGDAPPLVGFIVARTVGDAVTRNRVRRRLRHRLRDHLHRLPRGSLLVVRANPAAGAARDDELAADVESALDRLLRPASKGRK